MIQPTYFNAVQNLTSNKALHGHGHGPIAKIVLVDGVTPPTEDAIQVELTKLTAEYEAQEYARRRAIEYPSTGDQLDYIFHNGVAKWKTDMIEPVKAKYPKKNVWPGYGNPADL